MFLYAFIIIFVTLCVYVYKSINIITEVFQFDVHFLLDGFFSYLLLMRSKQLKQINTPPFTLSLKIKGQPWLSKACLIFS